MLKGSMIVSTKQQFSMQLMWIIISETSINFSQIESIVDSCGGICISFDSSIVGGNGLTRYGGE